MLLIVVLILIGSIAATVISVSEDSYILDEYVQRTIEYERIYMMADAAIKAIREIFKNDDENVDYFGELWSQRLTIPLENGEIQLLIVDQERYLNPNYLVSSSDQINKKYLSVFEKLFYILDIDNKILYNIIDWIDKNEISNGGIEKYTEYTAKNSPIDTLEELHLIDGIDKTIFNGTVENGKFKPGLKTLLSPYSNGKININTASKWILISLDSDIDETLADAIISYRKKKPFKKLEDLILVDGMNSDIIHRISPIADVKSKNFLAIINIIMGNRKYKLEILFERNGKKIKEKWKRIY